MITKEEAKVYLDTLHCLSHKGSLEIITLVRSTNSNICAIELISNKGSAIESHQIFLIWRLSDGRLTHMCLVWALESLGLREMVFEEPGTDSEKVVAILENPVDGKIILEAENCDSTFQKFWISMQYLKSRGGLADE